MPGQRLTRWPCDANHRRHPKKSVGFCSVVAPEQPDAELWPCAAHYGCHRLLEIAQLLQPAGAVAKALDRNIQLVQQRQI